MGGSPIGGHGRGQAFARVADAARVIVGGVLFVLGLVYLLSAILTVVLRSDSFRVGVDPITAILIGLLGVTVSLSAVAGMGRLSEHPA